MGRFLLDENVPLTFQSQLEQLDPELKVYVVGDDPAPPKGTPDPDILNWLEANDCLLITNNRASMPVHLQSHLAQGRHVLGIIQLPKRASMGTILDDVLLIGTASLPNEYLDQIVYLPLRR